jgi:hypothetical protein
LRIVTATAGTSDFEASVTVPVMLPEPAVCAKIPPAKQVSKADEKRNAFIECGPPCELGDCEAGKEPLADVGALRTGYCEILLRDFTGL